MGLVDQTKRVHILCLQVLGTYYNSGRPREFVTFLVSLQRLLGGSIPDFAMSFKRSFLPIDSSGTSPCQIDQYEGSQQSLE